jgi:hypothetical protein
VNVEGKPLLDPCVAPENRVLDVEFESMTVRYHPDFGLTVYPRLNTTRSLAIVGMGRRTFEATIKQGGNGSMPGLDVVVFSRTLQERFSRSFHRQHRSGRDRPIVERKSGRDIWLFGGGIPLLPACATRTKLELIRHVCTKSPESMLLEYAVRPSSSES